MKKLYLAEQSIARGSYVVAENGTVRLATAKDTGEVDNTLYKKTYWGVVRNRRVTPTMLFDKGNDAKHCCNRLNRIYESDKKKPYYVKRFVLEFKGEQVDTYEHTTRRIIGKAISKTEIKLTKPAVRKRR